MVDDFLSRPSDNWWDDLDMSRIAPPQIDVPDDWGLMETQLFGQLSEWNPDVADDPYAQYWYDKALFHNSELSTGEIEELQADLKIYLWDTYGIEFDYQFDWDAYREWYNETA